MAESTKTLPGAPSATDAASSAPRARRRRPLRALAIGCAVALVGGELFCRWRWGAPIPEREPLMEVRANRARGFEMLPSSVHYTYLHEVRVNSLGLRGPEPRPASEVPTIVCLGDSMVYGQGVAEADTLPARIEARLRSHSIETQALNAALRSYDTRQELALLEELLPRVHPGIVVLFWFANDLEPADIAGWASSLERSGPVVFDVRARMEGGVRLKWKLVQLARHSALLMKLHDAWTVARWKTAPPQTVDHQFEALERELQRFARLAREHDFEALVAVIPSSDLLAREGDAGSAAPRVLSLARAAGLAGLDLLPALRAQRAREGRANVLAYDGHYDGRANAAMAEQVADELEQRFARRLERR